MTKTKLQQLLLIATPDVDIRIKFWDETREDYVERPVSTVTFVDPVISKTNPEHNRPPAFILS